jgi:hypothetical protein
VRLLQKRPSVDEQQRAEQSVALDVRTFGKMDILPSRRVWPMSDTHGSLTTVLLIRRLKERNSL